MLTHTHTCLVPMKVVCPELELWMIMGCRKGSGNQTLVLVLCKSSKCFYY